MHRGRQPGVRGTPFVAQAEALGDAGLVFGVVGPRVQGEVEDLLLLAAEQGQDAVRGQPREWLAELEVVGELGALLFLALPHFGAQRAAGGHRLAQFPEQVRVLGEPFDEDRAGTVQSRGRVRDAALGVDEVGRLEEGIFVWVGEEQVGQRLQARLAGDLGPSAALRLIRQVQVLQPRLGVSGADLALELVGQLALGAHLGQDRIPALVEFAQVTQAFLERAQLRVVERAGGFLAVPGDERHGGAAVEQLHGGADLPDSHAQLVGDPLVHGLR